MRSREDNGPSSPWRLLDTQSETQTGAEHFLLCMWDVAMPFRQVSADTPKGPRTKLITCRQVHSHELLLTQNVYYAGGEAPQNIHICGHVKQ